MLILIITGHSAEFFWHSRWGVEGRHGWECTDMQQLTKKEDKFASVVI